ncbi:hypothetical protein D3C83_226830 [compost metagenome]
MPGRPEHDASSRGATFGGVTSQIMRPDISLGLVNYGRGQLSALPADENLAE